MTTTSPVPCVVSDLMSRSALRGMVGLPELLFVKNEGAFIEALQRLPAPSAAIIDLASKQPDALTLVRQWKESGSSTRLYVFGPHVEVDLFNEVKKIGVTGVYPRSRFFTEIGKILGSS